VISGPFALALSAGMIATVNPCGFAMLPAYLSYFLGLTGDAARTDRTAGKTLARAFVVSGALLLGFLTVFGTFGIVIRGFGVSADDILRYARWPATAIGVVLVLVGIALIAGWHLPFATPRMNAGGRTTQLRSMYVFGCSYAVTSLSCGSAPFIATVVGSFRRNGFVSGVFVFVVYAIGMGLVVTALTISMALAQQGFLHTLRKAMAFAERAAGALMVIAGLYLVYYWGFEGGTKDNAISRLQSRVESWFGSRSNWTLISLFGGIVLIGVLVVLTARRSPAMESNTHAP
jgi:cytochrome c-type biogenesis protein